MARSTSRLSESEREQRRARDRERLQQAAEQLLSSDGWERWVRVRSRNGLSRYSINNQLLIALARPDATFVAGFRAWLELGYQVGKGEKAIWILAPLKIKERDRASGEETGETRTLFRAVPVFDRAQVTAGEHATPLEPPLEPLSGDSHEHLLVPLERFADSLGFTVSFETIAGPAGGWCDYKRKRIVVDADQPANARVRVLIHEIAHAMGVDYQQYFRPQAEVIVDTVSFVVGSSVHLDLGGETIPYIAGWGETGALDAVTEFAATIDRMAARSSRRSKPTTHPQAQSWRSCLPCDVAVPASAWSGRRMAIVVFSHYPPVDELAAARLRAATVAWAPLLGELHAAGFRPYLELELGQNDDPLRVFCELDNETLLDISIGDEGIPDEPEAVPDSDWVVFVQSISGGYLAEV